MDLFINHFINHPGCFTIRDIIAITNDKEEADNIYSILTQDSRFVVIALGANADDCIISKISLYKWYIELSIRLAEEKVVKLDYETLCIEFSKLLPSIPHDCLPSSLVAFGEEHYFINILDNTNVYGFPIAYLFSHLPRKSVQQVAAFLIDSFDGNSLVYSHQDLLSCIHSILEILDERKRFIITRRQGLFGNPSMTLEQIGNELGVTRERIRQIEQKCWRRIRHPQRIKLLVISLIITLLENHFNLAMSSDQSINELLFTARCLNIPFTKFQNTDIYILGFDNKNNNIPKDKFASTMNTNGLAEIFINELKIPLSVEQLDMISQSLRPELTTHTYKIDRVYEILKQIGRPSHFSYITDIYNEMFPDDYSNEHSIHSTLLRDQERIVWIGIKGTYALKEWGFDRPSKSLFDTIAEIVKNKYMQTGRPVALNTIQAEIGKYRKIVKPNSVLFASYFNESLINIHKDHFIPKEYASELPGVKTESEADLLDRVLRQFEQGIKKEVSTTMPEQMSFERALQIANEALEAYKQAKTKEDVEEIFIKYGRNGIGYRPLCRIFFSQRPPEIAVKAYKKE